jgi:hypothetical protein
MAVVPVDDAKRPQRVPSARTAVAVLELELGLSRVGVLEQPGAVRLPLVADKLHGRADPIVGASPVWRKWSRPRRTS